MRPVAGGARVETVVEWGLGTWKGVTCTFQSLATIIAWLVGRYWTYNIFILERGSFPHVEISQHVAGKLIFPKWHWIHLSIDIKNTGKAIVNITKADIKIQ
jgi:hypothetical protein